MYNLTSLQETGNPIGVVTWANTITNGILFQLMCVAVFIILLVILSRSASFDESLLLSSFISFVLSIILATSGLISLYTALLFLAITALTGLYIFGFKD